MKRCANLVISVVMVSASLTSVAIADDLNVPPWWQLPGSLYVEWDEVSPGQGDLATGPLNIGDPATPYPISDADLGAGPGQPALEIVPGPDGIDYRFFLPNYVDRLPIKNMRIQVTYSGLEPSIVSIVGSDPDSPVAVVGPKNHVVGIPDNPLATGYYYEDWDLFPNPDWEVVHLLVPTATRINQVVIDSISIPEPSAMALAFCGLVGAAIAGRRRRSG
jgi:hypothetical protein